MTHSGWSNTPASSTLAQFNAYSFSAASVSLAAVLMLVGTKMLTHVQLKALLGARVTAFNHAARAKGLVYPRYEGGFFVTVFTENAHERALRMKEQGVFVVPAKGALRVALCSVAEKDVPRLVDALAS